MAGPHHRGGTQRSARRPGTIRVHPAAVFPRLARNRTHRAAWRLATFALGDQVFLYVVGNSTICLAGTDLLRVIPRDKNDWRDVALLDLTNTPFQKLRVHSAGRIWSPAILPIIFGL